MNQSANYYIYILECSNNTYYTGYTNDLNRRYQAHVDGSAKCRYTRSFKPLRIAQSWTIHSSKSNAMKIEAYVKKLSKKEKEQLVLNPDKIKAIFNELVFL